jgi:hypothetical protein
MGVAWYVMNDGSEAIGPVTTEQLVNGIVGGRVPLTSVVCPVGATAWSPLAAYPELAAAVRRFAPPPLPPALEGSECGPEDDTAENDEDDEDDPEVAAFREEVETEKGAAEYVLDDAEEDEVPPDLQAMIDDWEPAADAVRALRRAGFPRDDLHYIIDGMFEVRLSDGGAVRLEGETASLGHMDSKGHFVEESEEELDDTLIRNLIQVWREASGAPSREEDGDEVDDLDAYDEDDVDDDGDDDDDAE